MTAALQKSKFVFGQRSESNLRGVHPDLRRVARRALELSPVDFGITEGLRTESRQRELVAAGASKTMDSRHLTGHAVDVAAYLGTELRWDFGLYLQIAYAFRAAAIELGVSVVWGACWQELNTTVDLERAIAAYAERKRRDGGEPLIDGPHFELSKRAYPA